MFIKLKYTLDFDHGDILNKSGEIDRAKIMVHAYTYTLSPIDKVDSKWVNEQMLRTGTKAKDIATDTGIEKTNISPWINNKKTMSQIVKAMFYYYFASKK